MTRAHAAHAARAKPLRPCVPADLALGGTCRNCGCEWADQREDVLTIEGVLDKLVGSGARVSINGKEVSK